MALSIDKSEFPLPKDVVCQVWMKIDSVLSEEIMLLKIKIQNVYNKNDNTNNEMMTENTNFNQKSWDKLILNISSSKL